jgi:hypothetical protein
MSIFCVFHLLTWQVLHDFVMDWMVFLKPLQYIAAFIVSLRRAARGAEDGGDTT